MFAHAIIISMLAIAHGGSQQTFESGTNKVRLVELYSSEGCSSCPPADAWLATLRQNRELWKSMVPIEFHVDYWNRLGWIDRFSHQQFTTRQADYSRSWQRNGVYTPGFVLNGREWRNLGGDIPSASPERVGNLKATRLKDLTFAVSFEPGAQAGRWTQPFVAHAALLGNGLESQVTSGENTGSTLRHEFVALALVQASLKRSPSGGFRAELALPAEARKSAKSYSIAVWVSAADSMVPIQATGGDL